MAAGGTGSLVFTYDVIADGCSRMNSEKQRAILSAQFQSNIAEVLVQRLTV